MAADVAAGEDRSRKRDAAPHAGERDAPATPVAEAGRDLKDAARRSGSLPATFKAVAASFFGVRGGKAHESDLSQLNPVHVVVVGLVCAAAFVALLILVVRWAVGHAAG